MKRGRTLGIGSMAVDRIRRVPRILGSEEKGTIHVQGGVAEEQRVGGVVLNHLGWAAVLGNPTGIFGKQADDAGGRFLRQAMDGLGIERHLVLDGSASTFADIFVDDSGERAIYMAPGATSETTPAFIREHFTQLIQAAARVTTEVSQLPLDAALCVLELAREAGVPTLLDLDLPPSAAVPGLGDTPTLEKLLCAADVLKPAKAAAAELVPEAAGDVLAVAEAMRARYGNNAVIVTDGAAGCAISAEGVALRVPSKAAKEVVDTTGAGDAFLGGLLVALANGLGWEDTALLANACGAACVEKLGAFPDDPAAAFARVSELYDGAPIELALPECVGTSAILASERAMNALGVAVDELIALRERYDPAGFDAAAACIRSCEARGGRLHVTGIGKPEHVAHYAASLLSSTGTPATFLHGTEAVHGSAGQVVAGDVVIAISNSGATELTATAKAVRALGAEVIAVTGNPDSPLAAEAAVVLDASVHQEGGGLGLAPRASVAAELLVLAALSAALEEERGFTRAAYHARHPAGKLGEKSTSGDGV
ncbi:MAG: SIS domain-containing protein [bacterium]|nr:SIS domain-containing protein [bacterium]